MHYSLHPIFVFVSLLPLSVPWVRYSGSSCLLLSVDLISFVFLSSDYLFLLLLSALCSPHFVDSFFFNGTPAAEFDTYLFVGRVRFV